jgi:hypothetical protein
MKVFDPELISEFKSGRYAVRLTYCGQEEYMISLWDNFIRIDSYRTGLLNDATKVFAMYKQNMAVMIAQRALGITEQGSETDGHQRKP